MLQYDLQVEKREKGSRHHLRVLRRETFIPCIAYGHNESNRMFSIKESDLRKFFTVVGRDKALVNMVIDKDKFSAIIKEIKRSPRTNKIIHIDFQIIHLDEKLKVSIPVVLKGTAKGIKDGGIVEQILRNIEVKCLPAKIPSHIEIDITDLGIGEGVHVKEIIVEDAEMLSNLDEIIVTILAPKAVVEEVAKPEDESKEPEVITEKKEVEEEATDGKKPEKKEEKKEKKDEKKDKKK